MGLILARGFVTTLAAWPITRNTRLFYFLMLAMYSVQIGCFILWVLMEGLEYIYLGLLGGLFIELIISESNMSFPMTLWLCSICQFLKSWVFYLLFGMFSYLWVLFDLFCFKLHGEEGKEIVLYFICILEAEIVHVSF